MEASGWKLDGKSVKPGNENVSLVWEDNRFFSLAFNGKSFHGEILSNELESGKLQVKLNHRVFELDKEGPLDELIASLGLDKPKVRKLKQLKSPMPGRVVGVSVTVGQEVLPGDPLLTLEAMKMENVLKAEGSGTVKSILVEGQAVVEKGEVLIDFE